MGTPLLGGRDQEGFLRTCWFHILSGKSCRLKKESLVLLEGENSVPPLLTWVRSWLSAYLQFFFALLF